jgi:hypothetical protein
VASAAVREFPDSTQAQTQPLEEQPEHLDPQPALDQAGPEVPGAIQAEVLVADRAAVVVDQAPARIFAVVEAEVVAVAEAVAEAKAGHKAPQLFTARSASLDNAPIKSTPASTISMATQPSMPDPTRSPAKIRPKFRHGMNASAATWAARCVFRTSTTAATAHSST